MSAKTNCAVSIAGSGAPVQMLLSQLSSDGLHPSFFEVYAQAQLISSLKPALRYVLLVLAQRHGGARRALAWSDEVFHVLLLLVEGSSIRHNDGSFSENFYGLKRVRVEGGFGRKDTDESGSERAQSATEQLLAMGGSKDKESSPFKPLVAKDRLTSIFFLVVEPYLRGKLDGLHSDLLASRARLAPDDTAPSPTSFRSVPPPIRRGLTAARLIVARCFIKAWPVVTRARDAVEFVYELLYLFEYSRYYTPVYHLQRITLRRMSLSDTRKALQKQDTMSLLARRPGEGLGSMVMRILQYAGMQTVEAAKVGLIAAIFIFKFLEWWYSSENTTRQQALPKAPPPPEPLPPARAGLQPPIDKTVCPICKRARTNPTTIPSGYVFCYPCIFKQVTDNERCPITLQPCLVEDLHRIYELQY